MGHKKHKAALLLGGNIGDTAAIFDKARQKLQEKTVIKKASPLYHTQAWGMENAQDFLNQALVVRTDLQPVELLHLTTEIERAMGRDKENRAGERNYESRKLDIDILLFDDVIIRTPDLVIPHPKMHLRNFALVPMVAIAPEWIHPVYEKNMLSLLKECPDELKVKQI